MINAMRKIIVTGARGQLGRELCRRLGTRAIGVDFDCFDLTDQNAVDGFFRRQEPGAIINCAAYTQVDRAQEEPKRARAVNATAVSYLSKWCCELACPLVQISTDYVFDDAHGADTPWTEEDKPAARGVYAQTKLEGEQAAAGNTQHLIVRTCGLYADPGAAEAKNFVRTMLRLGQERSELSVVSDQRCTPTYVPHLARAVLFLLGVGGSHAAPWGIYHVTNTGEVTWYGFAQEIFRLAGLKVALREISTADYGAPAPRPAYSVLDTSKYHRLGGPPMPDWRAALAEYVQQWNR